MMTAFPMTARRRLAPALGVFAALLLGACSDSDDDAPTGDAAAPTDGPSEDDPLFVIGTAVFAPDSTSTYLVTADSLDGNQVIDDFSTYLEVPGYANIFGLENQGTLYLTSEEAGTITEVTFGDANVPGLGRTLSFANLGVSSTDRGRNLLLSTTKAYHVSPETLDVIVWNPETMEITNTIETELDVDPQYQFREVQDSGVRTDDRIVLFSTQYDDNFLPEASTTVTVLDTESDALVSNTVDERCQALVTNAKDAEGNTYYVPNTNGALSHHLFPELAPEQCMVRILAGETGFDPDFDRSLTEELGTEIWTGIGQGPDGTMYVMAIPEDNPDVTAAVANDDIDALFTAAPWTWYSLDGGDATPVPAAPEQVRPLSHLAYEAGGGLYIEVFEEGDDEVSVVRIDGEDGPEQGPTFGGFLTGIVKVR